MEKMLKKVCKERLGVKMKLRKADWRKDPDCIGYIDHQSSIVESPNNARMFMSEKMLIDFICNEHSYIRNTNDNNDNDEDLVYDERFGDFIRLKPEDYSR